MAYEYGTAMGGGASAALQLPVDEITGYFAFLSAKKDMIDDANNE